MTLLDLGIEDTIEDIVVPAFGKQSSKIIFVGEAPGKDEVRHLRPFVGRSGMLLRKMMLQSGIAATEVYMTNVVKLRPKNNDITPFFGKKGFSDEGRKWLSILKNELTHCQAEGATVVAAFGNTALAALCDKQSISRWRGSILESTLVPGLKIIPVIHPAAALRKYIDRFFIQHDLQRVRNESTFSDIRHPIRNHIINPRPEEAMRWLDESVETIKKGSNLICVDIEITGTLELSCIGFSIDPKEALCIPVAQYSLENEMLIMRKIGSILSDPELTVVGQNIVFDLDFLLKRYNIIPAGRIEDTMIAQGVLFPDFPKSLGFLCSVYTDEPYYKDEGKEWRIVRDWEKFWRYNCKDAATTLEIWHVLGEKLKREGYQHTYDMDMKKHLPCFYMMVKGMRADPAAVLETKKSVEVEIEKLQIELDKLVEPFISSKKLKAVDSHSGQLGLINVNSPKQLKEYFYKDLNIKPYLTKGKPTCDDKALQRLAKGTATRPGRPEAKVMQYLIKNKKFRGTYLDMKFDADSRFRCSYRPRGTIFGRLSSSKTIFHTGMNMQNIPANFKGFLYADKGYWLAEIDKKQAEWVATAFLSGDRNMISVADKNGDSHLDTAFLITKVRMDLILAENEAIGHLTDPEAIMEIRRGLAESNPEWRDAYANAPFIPRIMSIRQCGKKSNHGFNYGMGSGKFALTNEVPEGEAKIIRNSYHSAYPGLRQWYERIKFQLNKDRTLTNPFGRKVRLLDSWGENLWMQAYSFLPQSTVGDITVNAMCEVYNAPEANKSLHAAELLGNIHDSIIIQYPMSMGIENFAKCLIEIRDIMEPTISWEGREFVIKTDAKVGPSWGDMQDVDLYFDEAAMEQRLWEIDKHYKEEV